MARAHALTSRSISSADENDVIQASAMQMPGSALGRDPAAIGPRPAVIGGAVGGLGGLGR